MRRVSGSSWSAVRRAAPVAALGLSLAGAALPGAAHAQFFWDGWGSGGWGGLGPAQIADSVASQGFRIVGPLRRRGAVFVAEAIDPRGLRERIVVAAADGQIVQRVMLGGSEGFAPRRMRPLPRDPYETPVDRADRGDMVPPADVPDTDTGVRRFGQPAYRAPDAYGTQAYGNGADEDVTTLEPMRPRTAPPRTVRPKPRIVERTPDTVEPDKPIQRRPLDAPSPVGPNQMAPAPQRPMGTAPAGQSPAAAAPTPPPSAPTTTTRMRDPLALPGGDGRKPDSTPPQSAARIIPGVTGTPSAPPLKTVPPRGGDVPVAPLD